MLIIVKNLISFFIKFPIYMNMSFVEIKNVFKFV